jgi:NAD(P)-dependent dehydrogenase (short-subunit alcohol dehydrogenase family)
MSVSVARSVVITGASSGIGRASVARMIARGWRVFATVRKQTDAAELQASFGSQVAPIILDVTQRDAIASAGLHVREQLQGRGLDGLVNVAGVGIVRPVEYATHEEIQEIFNINVFGQIAVTQTLLPLIRQARGRIVNITTIGVRLALPFGALLNASKSAFSAFSNALRLELHPFGVRVVAIEPAAIRTPAVEKTLGNIDEVIRNLPPRAQEQYGVMMKKLAARGYSMEMNGSPPDVVAEAVERALTARRPRFHYVVGKHARLLTALPKVLPERALDSVVLRIAGMPTKFGAATRSQPRTRRHAA